MYVVYGADTAKKLKDRFIVLETDTFRLTNGGETTAYCVVSADNMPVGSLPEIPHWVKFHNEFVHGYKTQQWMFCLDCLGALRGKFGGELNSYYDVMEKRILGLMENGVPEGWEPIVVQGGDSAA